jgi:transposase-like protein
MVADTLRPRFAKLAELMDGAEDDVLAHMTFPKEHWPQLASTNPLERVNGEIKRRTNVVGIFPNAEAIALPTMLPNRRWFFASPARAWPWWGAAIG